MVVVVVAEVVDGPNLPVPTATCPCTCSTLIVMLYVHTPAPPLATGRPPAPPPLSPPPQPAPPPRLPLLLPHPPSSPALLLLLRQANRVSSLVGLGGLTRLRKLQLGQNRLPSLEVRTRGA